MHVVTPVPRCFFFGAAGQQFAYVGDAWTDVGIAVR